MATQIKTGALNVFHDKNPDQQMRDIDKMMSKVDVLSLQEVEPNLLRAIKQAGYGVYMKDNYDAAVVYNADRFEKVQGRSFVLNKTHGKGNLRKRKAAAVLLRDKETGEQFWQVSLHMLPRRGKSNAPAEVKDEILLEQFRNLSRLIPELKKSAPVSIAGDFNNKVKGKGGRRAIGGKTVEQWLSDLDLAGHVDVMGGFSSDGLDHTGGRVVGERKLASDHGALINTFDLDGSGRGADGTVNYKPKGAGGFVGGGGRPKDGGRKSSGGSGAGGDVKDWAADYGWSYAFLKDHPKLKSIFDEAIANSWSPQRFVAEIQDTPWFKKHADTWRQAAYLEATDPQTYKQRTQQIRAQIADAAGSLGLEVSGNLLDKWAEQSLKFGWNDAQIKNHLASQVQIMGKHANPLGGDLATTQENLNRWANDNAVKINKKTMQTWLRHIVRGTSTMEEYKQYITKQAVAQHPNWSKELQSGMSLAQLADPYRNMMAQVLEMNPEDINLNGRLLRNALSYKKEDGSYDAMSLYDFEDLLRKDPRWMKTDNAKEEFMNTGSAVLKMFGLST